MYSSFHFTSLTSLRCKSCEDWDCNSLLEELHSAKREGSDLKIRKKKINTHVLKKKERIAQKGNCNSLLEELHSELGAIREGSDLKTRGKKEILPLKRERKSKNAKPPPPHTKKTHC